MIIENPFVFGRAAEGAYFTDRIEELKIFHPMYNIWLGLCGISQIKWSETRI